MIKGVVKTVDYLKGFGFIVTEDDEDVYFSLKDMHPKFRSYRVKEGDRVGFDLKREMRGDRAVNVRPL